MFQVEYEPPNAASSEDSVENILEDSSKQASNETIIHSDSHHILGSSFLSGHIFPFISSPQSFYPQPWSLSTIAKYLCWFPPFGPPVDFPTYHNRPCSSVLTYWSNKPLGWHPKGSLSVLSHPFLLCDSLVYTPAKLNCVFCILSLLPWHAGLLLL